MSSREREVLKQKFDQCCMIVFVINVLVLVWFYLPTSRMERVVPVKISCPTLELKWQAEQRIKLPTKAEFAEQLRHDDAVWRSYLKSLDDDGPAEGGDKAEVKTDDVELDSDKDRRDEILARFAGGRNESGLCPVKPPGLVGNYTCACEPTTPEVLQALYPEVKSGRLQPSNCTARERLAVVIAYRDRYSHLHTLLNVLIPLLKKQQADATFFVIEQDPVHPFNRALLQNVGFLESQKLGTFDCYIFHDVDLVPMNDQNLYRCADNPLHFAVAIKKYGRRSAKKMYNGYFGGVVGFTKEQYLDVNGNSNLYFGWGGEDDDLLMRVQYKNYKRPRLDERVYHYSMLRHERNDRARGNVDRKLLLVTATDRQDMEGLSTTRYNVTFIKHLPLYVWVQVSFNLTEVMQTAPDFTLGVLKPRRHRNVPS
ncbi:beta-1,4-galactosyltransferase 4-like isoform X3 [Physella acuta]|uniref:beta-1,4-galactosyltransferase 4-like isoform X3 n=1 Tax=Physella acuta TaxID=109671 RepID=UPI0027DE7DE0|nr:beta-1,4-galactosyltransferase 4-like isoform X3 [Physella acuta]